MARNAASTPGDGRAAETREPAPLREWRHCARNAPGRRSGCCRQRAADRARPVTARYIHRAKAGKPQRPQRCAPAVAIEVDEGDAYHRCREDDAVEPALAARRGAEQHGRAHGMAESENRRRAIRQHDLAHEGFEVGVEIGEVAHMAFAADRTARDPTIPGRASRGWRRRSRGCADRARSRNISRSTRCDPGRCTPCPAGPPAAQTAQSAALTPSGVLSMPVTALSGTGLAGMEMSFITTGGGDGACLLVEPI